MIICFFQSGLNEEELESIKNTYSYLTIEEISEFQTNPNDDIDSFFSENQIDLDEFPVEKVKDKPKEVILDLIKVSLNNNKYFFPKDIQNNHEVIFSGVDSFIINNTFILAIKKRRVILIISI
ncbi:hypothetical protein [Chryseobacterium sp. MMS23-Vi53]|uniref:hypothetical protein n=1 Tax=Chryseobacterium sp. MMS23-Vi53 TaxID=3386644 RepID=UPI0039E8DC32